MQDGAREGKGRGMGLLGGGGGVGRLGGRVWPGCRGWRLGRDWGCGWGGGGAEAGDDPEDGTGQEGRKVNAQWESDGPEAHAIDIGHYHVIPYFNRNHLAKKVCLPSGNGCNPEHDAEAACAFAPAEEWVDAHGLGFGRLLLGPGIRPRGT